VVILSDKGEIMPKKNNLSEIYRNLDITKIFQNEIKKAEESLEKIEQFYKKDLKYLDRLSDRIAEIGGSWTFIFLFFIILFSWMITNTFLLANKPFDPYPFILLNLFLSCLAAIQAPIILMAQNRAAKRDQIRIELDLEKDLRDLHIDQKSHHLLVQMQKDVDTLKKKMNVK
jgi:uncharacterized membrane protein